VENTLDGSDLFQAAVGLLGPLLHVGHLVSPEIRLGSELRLRLELLDDGHRSADVVRIAVRQRKHPERRDGTHHRPPYLLRAAIAGVDEHETVRHVAFAVLARRHRNQVRVALSDVESRHHRNLIVHVVAQLV
jgi:hypothetical protein